MLRVLLGGLFVTGVQSQFFFFDDFFETAAANCSCGNTNPPRTRIINGEETGVNEYTFMVYLYTEDDDGSGYQCGGSIISQRHVISAAHCTRDIRPSKMVIAVGDHDVSTMSETPYTRMMGIIAKYEHPNYDPENTLGNDIVVLVTRDNIMFNEAVGPICMPTGPLNIDYMNVKIIGWGTTEDGSISPVLKDADTTVISRTMCRLYWTNLPRRTQCVYNMDQAVCFGDSGGPVAYLDPSERRYILTGVTSFVRYRPCDPDYPTVNTAVADFVKWIQKVISDSTEFTGQMVRTCSIV